MPRGQSTNGAGPAMLRQAPQAHSGRSAAPCNAITIGRGSVGPSGTASAALPQSGTSGSVNHASARSGGSFGACCFDLHAPHSDNVAISAQQAKSKPDLATTEIVP